jgi:cobalt/nickel transport system permease protein
VKNNIQELYALEQLSGKDTCIHKLHPTVKLLTAAIFIVTVISFDRYAFGRLIPYVFYPALMMALSETPYSVLFKRFLIALPFCLFAGIGNVIFDQSPAFMVSGITVSYGIVSLFAILFKAYLCVMAALLLVSATPLSDIAASMRRLLVPEVFVTLFEMIYRYIGVLFEEAFSMYTAYSLRSGGGRGVKIGDMGSFAGQLLLRSFDRAERVYSAMKCRGYPYFVRRGGRKLKRPDVIFGVVTCFLCVALRVWDFGALFVEIFGGTM